MIDKTIVSKRLPFYLIPIRALYRLIASNVFRRTRLFQVERNGLKYLLWANEDIGKRMILQGSYEANELMAFARLIKQGDICVDVGGNVGIFSLNFARYCGEKGFVYVIEPIRKNQLVIELAALLNGFANIKVLPLALSDREGEVVMEMPSIDGAYAFIKPTDETVNHDQFVVRCLPLSQFVDEQRLGKVDVLKIDVEGAEKLVLDGGFTILANAETRPRVVMVELVDEFLFRYEASIADVLQMMSSIGYKPFYANSEGELIPYGTDEVNKIFNVFFIKG